MWQYGDVAVGALERYTSGRCATLREAWEQSASTVFPDSASLREKLCPRASFFGLCEEGLVRGVPPGIYNARPGNKNKGYAVGAVGELVAEPGLADAGPTALWQRVMAGRVKQPNSQMHLVLLLWKRGLIDAARVSSLTRI